MQIIDLPTTQLVGYGTARRAWERGGFCVFSVGQVLKEESNCRERGSQLVRSGGVARPI
jgi:hypothetical protein